MKLNNKILQIIVVTIICALASPMTAVADDVIIRPGYIAGQILTGTPNSIVRNISVSASGGGYSSSKNVSGNSYTLTVQGGDWNYAVSASATASPTGKSYPYTSLYFSTRTFPVAEAQTVTNNYSASGTVRFQVNITGDQYNNWYAYGYAYKAAASGQEQTNSQSYTQKYYSPEGTWDMPVVPNDQIRIYARVVVDSSSYYFWYSSNYRYENIGPDQTIVIPLDIQYVKPVIPHCQNGIKDADETGIDCGGADCPACYVPPVYDYGSIQGNVYLNLNVDSKDYSTSFSRHYVSGYYGTNLYTNPGDYLHQSVRTGTYTYRNRTYFSESGRSFYLYWPYTNGYPQNDYVTVYKDQTSVKDLRQDAGILSGNLKFKGTLKLTDLVRLNYIGFSTAGATNFYVPGQGWVRQITNGGSTSNTFSSGPDNSYRFFLTPGPWMPYYFNIRSSKTVTSSNNKQYTSSFQTAFYDYNYYYDGNTYNFGQPVYITAGAGTVQDREYCAGALTLRFRVVGGGLLSSPYVSGNGYNNNAAGKREMYASTFAANANANKVDSPELDMHGPPGDYTLSTVRVVTEDGSTLYLKPVSIKLKCGVWLGRDTSGPAVDIISPEPEIITNAASVTVTGTASDDTGVTDVKINDVSVPFTPTGNPDVPNEVAFTYTLATTNGMNTIVAKAYDAVNNEGFDRRSIYVDRWMPTATILSPAEGAIVSSESVAPVSIQAADQGYGFTLKVYLDNNLIHEASGPSNETASEAISFITELGGLLSGPHVVRADVSDRAGNSASTSVNFSVNTPPAVTANGPYSVNEGGTTTVSATGSDPEGGPLSYAWDLDNDGNYETPGRNAIFSAASIDGPASRTISVKAVDDAGFSAVAQTNVFVANVAPTAVFSNASGAINEGGSVRLEFTNQLDPGAADTAAGFRYSYDCTSDGTFESSDTPTTSFVCSYPDNGDYTVTGRIQDKDGDYTDYAVHAVVNNTAPTVFSITAPIDPVAVNSTLNANAQFIDAGVLDTHTAVWEWGDNTSSNGIVSEENGSGSVSGSHAYAAAGVYTVKLTVTDNDGGAGSSTYRFVVVYDPGAGFVTGGGWINSPAGAYAPDPSVTGKVNFGFVAKYHREATVPAGSTEFNLSAGRMNFHSETYEWLVVDEAKAIYKGLGTINGSGKYGFIVAVIDGDLAGGGVADAFRIRIWDKDNNDAVIYDNQPGLGDDEAPTSAVEKGSIVIHKTN